MMVFKRKQIVVLALVLLIVVSGYLQYASNRSDSMTAEGKDNSRLGEAAYVDGKDVVGQTDNEGKASGAVDINDYFVKAKMERASSRSMNTDALKEITQDTNATQDVKAKAYDQIMLLAALSEKEMKIETTLEEKGFEDALAICADDGSVDIFVKAKSLTAENVALIADVASRQAKIPMTSITVKNIN